MACGLVSFVAFYGMEGVYFDFDVCRYLDLLLFCSCRYRTIADRLLCMNLVPSRRLVKRDVSYEFMNRQIGLACVYCKLFGYLNSQTLIRS